MEKPSLCLRLLCSASNLAPSSTHAASIRELVAILQHIAPPTEALGLRKSQIQLLSRTTAPLPCAMLESLQNRHLLLVSCSRSRILYSSAYRFASPLALMQSTRCHRARIQRCDEFYARQRTPAHPEVWKSP